MPACLQIMAWRLRARVQPQGSRDAQSRLVSPQDRHPHHLSFLCLGVCLFWTFPRNGIMAYATIWD